MAGNQQGTDLMNRANLTIKLSDLRDTAQDWGGRILHIDATVGDRSLHLGRRISDLEGEVSRVNIVQPAWEAMARQFVGSLTEGQVNDVAPMVLALAVELAAEQNRIARRNQTDPMAAYASRRPPVLFPDAQPGWYEDKR